MILKMFAIVGSALLTSAAFAQTEPSLGTVRNIRGLATETDGASVKSPEPGEAIRDGARFVTSSSGSVTLQLNNGCTLNLEPNQAVTINKNMTCRELVAAVEPVGRAAGVGGGFIVSGSPGAGALAVGGLVLAEYAIDRAFVKGSNNNQNNQKLSGQ